MTHGKTKSGSIRPEKSRLYSHFRVIFTHSGTLPHDIFHIIEPNTSKVYIEWFLRLKAHIFKRIFKEVFAIIIFSVKMMSNS